MREHRIPVSKVIDSAQKIMIIMIMIFYLCIWSTSIHFITTATTVIITNNIISYVQLNVMIVLPHNS